MAFRADRPILRKVVTGTARIASAVQGCGICFSNRRSIEAAALVDSCCDTIECSRAVNGSRPTWSGGKVYDLTTGRRIGSVCKWMLALVIGLSIVVHYLYKF